MKVALFGEGKNLGHLHQFMLSHLIRENIKEYKHHKYDGKTGLVIFYNDILFGRWMIGGKAYRSIHEVIKHGLIPALATKLVRKENETDLIKTQLELEINVDQYLDKDQLDKAIEILFQTILEKPTQELGLDINSDGDESLGMKVKGKPDQKFNPQDNYTVVIQNIPPEMKREDKSKITRMMAQLMQMPIELSERTLERYVDTG
jgi:hypothetical protein